VAAAYKISHLHDWKEVLRVSLSIHVGLVI